MQINDPVYGKFEINEPILIELINSPSFQRLKKIEQYGLPRNLYLFPGFSRFDHCIGVMLLLRKLGASLEEQISGLLHDVSHTAFSHIVDWVIGDAEKENFQDKNHKRFIKASEIPEILTKHGFDVERIIKIKKFKLLEQKSPNLCADRIDYALREFHYWLNKEIVKVCLHSLLVKDSEIIFKNIKSARIFAINFLRLQSMHWGGKDTITRYFLFAQILRISLARKIIKKSDFYSYDEEILKKIINSKNPQIQKILEVLSGSLFNYKFNPNKPITIVKKKFRFVDPKFLMNRKVLKLSQADLSFNEFLEIERSVNSQGVKLNRVT